MEANGDRLRVITASSLFDGHDAAINVFRRLFQKAGLEVIHIGHNRSVDQIVQSAIQEDADAVCISSYQGGHMEFFRYLRALLDENGGAHIGIFGGGGGTILPSEITALQNLGITRLYHAEDGRKLGLRGIIRDALSRMHKGYETLNYYEALIKKLKDGKTLSERELAKAITFVEQGELFPEIKDKFLSALQIEGISRPVIIGFTGPGGAGKSSLVDEFILRYLYTTEKGRVGVLAFDPTKKMTGGALLGDRIRMNAIYGGRVFLRSMATRAEGSVMSGAVDLAIKLMEHANFDLIILETTGIGQGDAKVVEMSDASIYVMTSEYGASSQLEKIDMIDYADVIAINKFDKIGAEDAFDDVIHAYANSRNMAMTEKTRDSMPVFGTVASDFNNSGVTKLFIYLMRYLKEKNLLTTPANEALQLEKAKELGEPRTFTIIPPEKTFYLGEIAEIIKKYRKKSHELSEAASLLYRVSTLKDILGEAESKRALTKAEGEIGEENKASVERLLEDYHVLKARYKEEEFSYLVRGKEIRRPLFVKSLSGMFIPKIVPPGYRDWGDIVLFLRKENLPGFFPYTAGVFPLKSEEEDPKRQFAGEGAPEKTNKRFHYLSKNDDAKRLSTAFDSVTLYGEDPDLRPDVYGKIGNSGVSIATLDDMKALYEGFDLCDPRTSVSLTINGPAPVILAMFLNTAIDFEVKKRHETNTVTEEEYQKIKDEALSVVRGTVQADILKEEQAQNTCIFSSKFALKMMGDIEEYFIKKNVKNFYSVSISGYHIAEAGANPISQLAFTLANGFTIVEYYLSRGMQVDQFARNLSFFFSSGLDPEYTVIGRVARRIWAVVMREKYGANERSCKLKYHIQTSGRSLHAQEIAFNDIRTTLQALLAISDNCNSLHTNAYDEAITTPTEESVRRAMAIQMILTKEFGLMRCENALQGSFFIEQLTDMVEEAVLQEFESISRRGGVLGAMEKQYQRHRIQTESMKYEMMKATGELPIIGVNTFISEDSKTDYEHIEVVRATEEEKERQIRRTKEFIARAGTKNREALEKLRHAALVGDNIFEELMESVKYCSLGQISHLLYECGGEYRRSM